MVDFLKHIGTTHFQICALNAVPRELLADFLRKRPDIARPVIGGMYGPCSVLIKSVGNDSEVITAGYDTEILEKAQNYLAEYIGRHDDITVSGAGADDFGDKMQRIINELKTNVDSQVYTTELAKKEGDYRIDLRIIVDRYTTAA